MFVPIGPIDNQSSLVQEMDLHQKGGEPLPGAIVAWITDIFMRHSTTMS